MRSRIAPRKSLASMSATTSSTALDTPWRSTSVLARCWTFSKWSTATTCHSFESARNTASRPQPLAKSIAKRMQPEKEKEAEEFEEEAEEFEEEEAEKFEEFEDE